MVTLLLRFSGRRYHATPWEHHVNEGLIEWPPSPWRLLRALLATGYTKLRWPPDGPPVVARAAIEKLAAVLPVYRLPRGVGAHSRHYMPLARFKVGREETTMVFDSWAQLDQGTLAVRWDVHISDEEAAALAQLVSELGYLGRSESWVEGELKRDPQGGDTFDARPGEFRDRPGPGWEQVSLLAATSADKYGAWRRKSVADARAGTGVDLGKKKHTKAEERKLVAAEAAFPQDLIGCLQVETGWLHKHGWSQPPGSRKVLYWRRANSLESSAPSPRGRITRAASVECMLLSLSAISGNDHSLPPVTRVLPQAELLHRALNFHAARIVGHCPVLSGRDASRKPLTGHRHAHLLHLDLDSDGHLDHVLVWAPMGLDSSTQAAVRAVRRTFTKGGTAPLKLGLAASGSLSELAHAPPPLGNGLRTLVGGPGLRGRRWLSVTPFVPPRHLKKHGRNSLAGQLEGELAARGLPGPASVTVLDPHVHEVARRGRHFVRARRFGPSPPVDRGFMVELTFAEPVPGPLVLGYGCHFGMGLFSCQNGAES